MFANKQIKCQWRNDTTNKIKSDAFSHATSLLASITDCNLKKMLCKISHFDKSKNQKDELTF